MLWGPAPSGVLELEPEGRVEDNVRGDGAEHDDVVVRRVAEEDVPGGLEVPGGGQRPARRHRTGPDRLDVLGGDDRTKARDDGAGDELTDHLGGRKDRHCLSDEGSGNTQGKGSVAP